ncbi:molybdenum cofactor biosynthesis protein [Mycobacterium antarcticum]|uniref:MOSC domain-containing protein n=1 Tax=unclassified Mycolicibacterium TaxID=2636767 RepID=UPI0024E0BB7B|nr:MULTISPECIES: MOSC domain-containing protein [unclassified Mycolicibacterium]BDX34923.1 molybdenum cofactor biosynthesis protein [Mycolicibacterium sp. TUM20985]
MATVLTVNRTQVEADGDAPKTGIDKRPTRGALAVRAPGSKRGGLGSGIAGDVIGNRKLHGGDDQAVYAYAREDLDAWAARLDRELTNGMFGENFTTSGVDVTGAVIGERWRVGSDGVLLEVTSPRTPCKTFAKRLGITGWIKTFAHGDTPGGYLRVIEPGSVSGGDLVEVVERPAHGITVGFVYRALMVEPDLLPDILAADALPEAIKRAARRRAAT